MERALTREEAARTLGVSVAADPETCKRAYRRLAQRHHPDRGGDAATFHDLQAAYERLASDEGPRRPVISRGRPSTPPVSFVDETERADVDAVAWQDALPEGRTRLDRDLVARWLAHDSPGLVTPLTATSRAPGSRFNRAAHLLASELVSTVSVRTGTDDRAVPVVAAEVVAATRRGRRALEAVAVTDGWVRRRRPSTTSLSVTLRPSRDRRATALRTADKLDHILREVGWSLPDWTLERQVGAGGRIV